ncbi:hypothetical protein CIHG_04632 [Coccidioides immitis H538.4]|uniref:Uncharacterized protein n=3 Tax=Coccidioides immitis TaxID=5501 RepID=A0A0J8TGZ6_COCIT|nr:hypothetical protein CIRG_06800 [Coccidioides immitis RMSCC 2394]KMU72942.1 hypothetical protein CISG_09956 [Coccidioides immitis RMSCC 3703]KMU86843.1 hypothetical protein CIHG_04632 [Coccidioides immitis H538.4]
MEVGWFVSVDERPAGEEYRAQNHSGMNATARPTNHRSVLEGEGTELSQASRLHGRAFPTQTGVYRSLLVDVINMYVLDVPRASPTPSLGTSNRFVGVGVLGEFRSVCVRRMGLKHHRVILAAWKHTM